MQKRFLPVEDICHPQRSCQQDSESDTVKCIGLLAGSESQSEKAFIATVSYIYVEFALCSETPSFY